MTKQHFEALAGVLANSRPDRHLDGPYIGPGDYDQWRSDCYAVAQACAQFNPRFDFDTFMDWCNSEGTDSIEGEE